MDVTTTAVFLKRKLLVDVELVQLRAYQTAEKTLVIECLPHLPPSRNR